MFKLIFFTLFSTAAFSQNFAQNPFIGTFTGALNGDNITLTMQTTSDNKLVGKMTDSQQSYQVNASTNGSKMEGTAVEKTLGLTFFLNGNINGNHLLMDLTIEVLGQKQAMKVDFTKQNAGLTSTKTTEQTPQYNSTKMPSNGKIDPEVVGKWVNEQLYNSGSGDNFFGGSTTQNLIFFEDGGLSDGGNSATMSGRNYSGSSSNNSQSSRIPNVRWYVQNQHIFILGMENGQSQTIDLGKYYIENGAMLITGNNGKKLLLRKKS